MIAPLGDLAVLTDRGQAAQHERSLPAVVAAVARAGAGAVIYREKDLGDRARLALGESIAEAVADSHCRLIVASDADLAHSLGATGVHLAQGDPMVADGCRTTLVVGRSCHSRSEVAAAAAEGVDYVTVSPLWLTASKPGHGPALGPTGAAALLDDSEDPATRLPAYGLGGVTPERVAACLDAGLTGVAVMGGVMTAPDPGRRAVALLTALRPAVEVVR